MDKGDWFALIEKLLYEREYASGTRELYRFNAKAYIEWCLNNGVDPMRAVTPDVLAYRQWILDQGLAPGTMEARTSAVRALYAFLVRTKALTESPTSAIPSRRVKRDVKDVLTIDEVSQLWRVAQGQDRIIVGLLALCAVRLRELLDARVEDFHMRDGTMLFSLPLRTGPHEFDHVAVPPQLAREISAHIGDRRNGWLLKAVEKGGQQVSARSVKTVISRTAKCAGIERALTSLNLTYTLRSLAIENRYSYLSVIRTVSEVEPRRLAQWARPFELPYAEHASMRLGRMVEAADSQQAAFFASAEFLLGDRSQHPAIALLLAAATLERVMREFAEASSIEVLKKDPTLNTYASLLRSHGLISLAELRTIDRILGFRNDAAHGYFDRVSRADARWVIDESCTIAQRLSSA